MSLKIASRIARRELRGGLRGFRIFLLCLTLGVGAIAAVGSVRVSIQNGLSREGAVLLGGDAELQFTHRFATQGEKDWMAAQGGRMSEIVDFRAMAVLGEDVLDTALTQVKAIDGQYPLYGRVELNPDQALERALSTVDGTPGAVMEQGLIDRLDLAIGDKFRLGETTFELRAALVREPDSAGSGFGFGPRTIVMASALSGSGLLSPGTVFDTAYRLALRNDSGLTALQAEAEHLFTDKGMRWRDKRNGTPGVAVFVERIGSFLVIVGLAGLAVGGVGVFAAVRAFLEGKTEVIATLKTLGAEGRMVFQVYFLQIGLLSLAGVCAGLALGAGLPLVFGPLIQAQLPIPAAIGIYPGPLLEAGLYGVLTAFLFTLWPLARARDTRAAALFRGSVDTARRRPRIVFVAIAAAALVALVGSAATLSGIPTLALWSLGGLVAAMLVLAVAAIAVRWIARRASGWQMLRGRTALRLALGSVGGPGGEASAVVLSLGLGLAVLATIGQIESNLRSAIDRELPAVAPSFFFLDIQDDQLDGFLARLANDEGIRRVDTAPLLRGIITQINDQPAQEFAPGHWVVEGDRGVTYAEKIPGNSHLTSGDWWPDNYDGPPLISFAQHEAEEIGLKLGDRITVNILGRDITASIASFRAVDFSDASINFVITMNPGALAGAPHTSIATVYTSLDAEAAILRDLTRQFPNITAISVRDAIERVSTALRGIAADTSYGAGATLLTGFVVLIGAAAAGERARTFEAAVLKTIGATRGRILASFALRSIILGVAAGGVAIGAGALAGWGVMRFVMDTTYAFEPYSALAIVTGGALATLVSGLGFAWRALAVRPAQVLRARE